MHGKHTQRRLRSKRDVDAAAQLATWADVQAGDVGIDAVADAATHHDADALHDMVVAQCGSSICRAERPGRRCRDRRLPAPRSRRHRVRPRSGAVGRCPPAASDATSAGRSRSLVVSHSRFQVASFSSARDGARTAAAGTVESRRWRVSLRLPTYAPARSVGWVERSETAIPVNSRSAARNAATRAANAAGCSISGWWPACSISSNVAPGIKSRHRRDRSPASPRRRSRPTAPASARRCGTASAAASDCT